MPAVPTIIVITLLSCMSLTFAQMLPPTTYSAKMLETIKKNAADFDSEDIEIRRRAVLVLSKYRSHMSARTVLVRALEDVEPRIRQAALVSLVDEVSDRRTSLAALRLLTDPSVSVRRICSAALPRLLLTTRLRTIRATRPIGSSSVLPKDIIDRIKKAHSDTDATVRKNLVAVWGLLPSVVDYATFSTLLKDADRDVRISTLDRGRFVIPSRQYLGAIAGMVDDKDRMVRLRLAETLGNYASIGNLKPLETLTKDADPEIRARALMGLMKAGRIAAWETLKGDIGRRRIKSSLAISAIELLPRLGAPGIKELKGYLDGDNAAFKTAALQTLAMYQPQAISDDAALAALKHASANVRNAASRIVARRPRLAASAVKTLAASPHQDVRQLALTAVGFAPREVAEFILMDLFLDESTTIRRAALRRIGRMRIDGWRVLMTDALEDNETAIREQAVLSLLDGARYPLKVSDPSLTPLKTYLKSGKDETLKTFIRSRTIMTGPLRK